MIGIKLQKPKVMRLKLKFCIESSQKNKLTKTKKKTSLQIFIQSRDVHYIFRI